MLDQFLLDVAHLERERDPPLVGEDLRHVGEVRAVRVGGLLDFSEVGFLRQVCDLGRLCRGASAWVSTWEVVHNHEVALQPRSMRLFPVDLLRGLMFHSVFHSTSPTQSEAPCDVSRCSAF